MSDRRWHLLVPVIILVPLLTVYGKVNATQTMNSASAAITKQIHADTNHSIGKALPAGIGVTTTGGHKVDLRTALQKLHGRITLVTVRDGHCPPCQKVLNYIKSHPIPDESKTHIVVLDFAKNTQPDLPHGVKVFFLPAMPKHGFLASHFVPEAFFFDKNLTLVGRHAIMLFPQKFLRYPQAPSQGH